MKKTVFLILTILAIIIPNIVIAEPVSEQTIEKFAKFWIKNNASFNQEKENNPGLKYKIRTIQKIALDSEELPAYGVELDPFGYLVIFSDDELLPVLSYSEDSRLDLTLDADNAFRNFLKRDLKAAKTVLEDKRTKKIKDYKTENKLKWKKYKEAAESQDLSSLEEPALSFNLPPQSSIIVDEMLQTRWNQNNHYNELTPANPDYDPYYDGNVPTGCVATAFAQLMKYHNWPWHGNGQHSYTDIAGTTQGSHTASFIDDYDWANMQNVYAWNNAELLAAVDAVSELMYEVGVASEMDYEPDGSGAYASMMHNRLASQFYYQRGTAVGGNGDLTGTLVTEMDLYAPCVVSIPGHAIVVDGRGIEGTDNYFHVNYGWGGTNNGWYLLNGVPNPSGQGSTIIDTVYPGNIPRAIPLIKASTPVEDSFLLFWKFPEYYQAAEAIRLFEGRMQPHALLVDTADDFSHWERAEGGTSQWTIAEGQFRWAAGAYFHFNVLDLAGPIVPTVNTLLEFDLRTCLGGELVNLEISTDNGETWTVLESWTNTGWSTSPSAYSINLAAYTDAEILVRFNAMYEGGPYYPTGGVWLDNISLTNFQNVSFVERTSDITTSLETQTVNVSNLTGGKTFYRVQTLNEGVWSDLSPIVETSVVPTSITHTLGVTVIGQGTVHSTPGTDMQCTGGCAQGYAQDSIVTLTADPDTGYSFAGWTGDCTGTGACTVTMDASKSVTAAFSQTISYPVILEGIPGSFSTIQQAYDSIPSGQFAKIKVKAGNQAPVDLYFGNDVTIILEGGYDDIFSTVVSDSEYSGTLTITSGSVTVSDLIIK